MTDNQKKTLIKISVAILLGICVLFVGLLISFSFYNMALSNPFLNGLELVLDPVEYQAVALQYGFNDPLLIKIMRYFINFFSGNWGESFIVLPGVKITEVMKFLVPRAVETILFLIIIGLIGIKLGRIWVKKRDKIQGKIIQIFTVIGLALPIFVIAPWMQIFGITIRNLSNGIIYIPVVFYSDPSLLAPPFITGMPLFDSIVSGSWVLAGDIILHGILPAISLSFVVIPLIIKQTQTNIERNSKETSFISNSFTFGKIFGILFVFVLIVEVTFNRTSFVYYFVTSINSGDLFLINGCIFIIIILFSFTIFFSIVIPIAYKFFRKKILKTLKPFRKKIHKKFKFFKSKDEAPPSISEPKIEVEKNSKTNPKTELKNYIVATLKNPFTIVGLGLIFYLGLISIFPQWFTPFSLQQVTRPYSPPGGVEFAPPSLEHPLGTTRYGYDLLALLIYGTREAFIFGSVVTLIGLAGGSIFGFLAGRLHRYVHNFIIGSMVVFFIIGIMLLILFPFLLGIASVMTIGLLFITIFTGIIANAIRRESNYINVIKVIIKYIPLEMAFGILLYQILGYMGSGYVATAQLGTSIGYGREQVGAYGAFFWPGFFIFIILLSLILLHEGLKAPTAQLNIINEPVITSSTTTYL